LSFNLKSSDDAAGNTGVDLMKKPTVSILIPAHNAADWIGQAVESALSQSYPVVEVIVVDDGSTDRTVEVLSSFGTRIQFRARGNRGGNPTRNELLAMSSGEWIQYLDADDYLDPDKVAVQMAALEQAQDQGMIDVIYSPVRTEYHRGRECVAVHPPEAPVSTDPWVLHARWELTQTGGALFRRSALEEVGAWNEDQACCQDNELFFRLLRADKRFLPCPGAVAAYRRFEGGTVSTSRREAVVEEILRILDATENYLRSASLLNPERLSAVNQHRFWLARNIWPWAPKRSAAIMQRVRDRQPSFQPEPSRFAPASYRACYRVLGFSIAESIAGLKRKLVRHAL
jgi:glycosyltransferase involved in cell wall biosynthesis